jgi:glycosyl transferase family 25
MWKIVVISLPAAVDRRAKVERHFATVGLHFEFRNGVDGHALGEGEISDVYDQDQNVRRFKRRLSRPEIGCYLSHYREWQRLAESNDQGRFIFEDDVEFDDDLTGVLEHISRLHLHDHFVKLDAPKKTRPLKTVLRLPNGRQLVEPRILPARTTGYGITRSAARKLVDGALPFFRPVDLDLKHWWETGVTPLAILPAPLRPATMESFIDDSRVANGSRNPFKRLWKNSLYQCAFYTALYRARFATPEDKTVKHLRVSSILPSQN